MAKKRFTEILAAAWTKLVFYNGAAQTRRKAINFTGSGVSVADNPTADPPRLDVTISSSGGSAHVIQDEAVTLTARPTLNFTGNAVAASDNAGNTRTDVAVSAVIGVQDDGVDETLRDKINFLAPLTSTDNAGNNSTDIGFDWDADSVTIQNVADPVNPQDAATRSWVLNNAAGGGATYLWRPGYGGSDPHVYETLEECFDAGVATGAPFVIQADDTDATDITDFGTTGIGANQSYDALGLGTLDMSHLERAKTDAGNWEFSSAQELENWVELRFPMSNAVTMEAADAGPTGTFFLWTKPGLVPTVRGKIRADATNYRAAAYRFLTGETNTISRTIWLMADAELATESVLESDGKLVAHLHDALISNDGIFVDTSSHGQALTVNLYGSDSSISSWTYDSAWSGSATTQFKYESDAISYGSYQNADWPSGAPGTSKGALQALTKRAVEPLRYTFSSTTGGTPATGTFRFDVSTVADVAEIRIHDDNIDGDTVTEYLQKSQTGIITVTNVDASVIHSFRMTSYDDDSGFTVLNVSHVGTGKGSIANNSQYVLWIDAAGASSLRFKYSNTIGGTPADGTFRLDSSAAFIHLATEIRVHDNDAHNVDVVPLLQSKGTGTVTIRSDDNTVAHVFSLTSVSDQTGYTILNVAHVDGSTATVSNGRGYVLEIDSGAALASIGSTGVHIYKGLNGGTAEIRRITGTGGLTASLNGDVIEIDGSAGGSGEVNTISSLGGDVDVAAGKSGVDLQLRGLTERGHISLTENANDIDVGLAGAVVSTSLGTVTPGSTTNNLTETGIGTALVLSVSHTGRNIITGLDPAAFGGYRGLIYNASTTDHLALAHDTTSTTGWRFKGSNGADVSIPPLGFAAVTRHDSTTDYWDVEAQNISWKFDSGTALERFHVDWDDFSTFVVSNTFAIFSSSNLFGMSLGSGGVSFSGIAEVSTYASGYDGACTYALSVYWSGPSSTPGIDLQQQATTFQAPGLTVVANGSSLELGFNGGSTGTNTQGHVRIRGTVTRIDP